MVLTAVDHLGSASVYTIIQIKHQRPIVKINNFATKVTSKRQQVSPERLSSVDA